MHFVLVIVAAIAGFIKFITEAILKKVVLVAALLLILSGLVVAFFLLINAAASGISAISPPFLSTASSWVIPDNWSFLLSALVTARIARWAYEWNVKVLQWRLY